MGLYPNILFHFTTRDGLYNILDSTFKISYARESIVGRTSQKEFGAPMVSFCDLRLSELKDHITKYGNYGIGMTRQWAYRKGLNPVMYVQQASNFTDDFIDGINNIYDILHQMEDVEKNEILSRAYMSILNTYRYLKNCEGKLIRKDKLAKAKYRFADEREWRYVPPIRHNMNYHPFVPIDQIRTSEQKSYHNQLVGSIRLQFNPNDIQYLIVEKDSEINPLIEHLIHVKRRFTFETVERLKSRILTVQQIKNDF